MTKKSSTKKTSAAPKAASQTPSTGAAAPVAARVDSTPLRGKSDAATHLDEAAFTTFDPSKSAIETAPVGAAKVTAPTAAPTLATAATVTTPTTTNVDQAELTMIKLLDEYSVVAEQKRNAQGGDSAANTLSIQKFISVMRHSFNNCNNRKVMRRMLKYFVDHRSDYLSVDTILRTAPKAIASGDMRLISVFYNLLYDLVKVRTGQKTALSMDSIRMMLPGEEYQEFCDWVIAEFSR